MTAADEILYPVGVENLFIAMMTGGKDAPTAIPTYETITSIPTIETIGIAGSTSTVQKWASNKLLVTATKNSQYTLTLDTPGIPLTIQDAIMGYIAAKGIVFDTADVKTLPCFAVGLSHLYRMETNWPDGTRKFKLPRRMKAIQLQPKVK